MTDGQLLYLIMALVYAAECLVWLPKGAYACLRSIGKRRRLSPAPSNFSSSKGGWIMAAPFPGLGTVFVTRSWPLCVTEDGVAAFSIESPNPGNRPESLVGPEFQWDQIEHITRDGKKILINEKAFIVESTPESAFQLLAYLTALWKSEPKGRPDTIRRELRKSWNTRRIAKLIHFWEDATLNLRALCNFLLLLLFGGIPACLIFYGPSPELWACGAAFLTVMISIASIFMALHRRLYPKLKFERIQWFFIILLVPQQSVRVLDLLFKAIVAGAHPLAVADFALSKGSEQRSKVMGAFYRDLQLPLRWKGEIITEYQRDFLHPELDRFTAAHEDEIKDWCQPIREDDEKSYCPRCFEKFSSDEVKKCQDCEGIPIVKWPDQTGSSQ